MDGVGRANFNVHLLDYISSGAVLHKPMNESTCCPSYTIRCDTENFQLSRSHKKCLGVMANFLNDGVVPEMPENSRDVSPAIKYSSPVTTVPASKPQIPSGPVSKTTKQRSGSSKRRRWAALQSQMKKRAETLGIPYSDVLTAYTERREKRLAKKNCPKIIEDYLAMEKPRGEAKHFLDVSPLSASS